MQIEEIDHFNENLKNLKVNTITLTATLKKNDILIGPSTESKFQNSSTHKLNIDESPNITVRIFKNGSVGITGCRTIETAHKLQEHFDNLKIVMIHCISKHQEKIPIKDKLDLLKNLDNFTVMFNPCRDHKINIKYINISGSKITILVYSSGIYNVIGPNSSLIKEAMDALATEFEK